MPCRGSGMRRRILRASGWEEKPLSQKQMPPLAILMQQVGRDILGAIPGFCKCVKFPDFSAQDQGMQQKWLQRQRGTTMHAIWCTARMGPKLWSTLGKQGPSTAHDGLVACCLLRAGQWWLRHC